MIRVCIQRRESTEYCRDGERDILFISICHSSVVLQCIPQFAYEVACKKTHNITQAIHIVLISRLCCTCKKRVC